MKAQEEDLGLLLNNILDEMVSECDCCICERHYSSLRLMVVQIDCLIAKLHDQNHVIDRLERKNAQ